jgi:hypothetical protein
MLSLLIWRAGILLEGLVLVQGFRAKLATRYSAFYLYILVMFLSDSLLYALYRVNVQSFYKWAVFGGYITLFLGCGLLLEIFRHAFGPYAGAEKIAKVAGTAALIGIVVFAVVYLLISPRTSAASATFIPLQRNFLLVQAILLIGLLRVISYYEIALGRNLKGIILGFGQCIGTTLIAFALRAYIGHRFQAATSYLQQVSYLSSLVIWLVALWSYRPNPVPETRISAEADYDRLASRTRDMVGAASAELVRVERL